MKGRKLFREMELEQLNVHRQRNETSPKPHGICDSDHGLSIKHRTVRLLDKKHGKPSRSQTSKAFLDLTSKIIQGKINTMDPIKIKNFYSVKVCMKRMKRQVVTWGENICKPCI